MPIDRFPISGHSATGACSDRQVLGNRNSIAAVPDHRDALSAVEPGPVIDGAALTRWSCQKPQGIWGQRNLRRPLFHFPLGGLLDLLGLRDGVFPGVALLSRRR